MKYFEKNLPENYEEIMHIDAADKRTGTILTVFSLLIMVIVLPLCFIGKTEYFFTMNIIFEKIAVPYFVLLIGLVLYIILHELVHGIAYYFLTHQKLTFGLKWSCAFCGVPDIYTYRKTALIALVSPLIVFTIIFLIVMVICDINNLYAYYIVFSILFSMHISGCVGDIYMTILLLMKFRNNTVLMKDTGPEQWIYDIKD